MSAVMDLPAMNHCSMAMPPSPLLGAPAGTHSTSTPPAAAPPPTLPWAPGPGVSYTSTHVFTQTHPQPGAGTHPRLDTHHSIHTAAPSSIPSHGLLRPPPTPPPVFLGGMGRPYNPVNNSVGTGACIGQVVSFKPAVATLQARLRQHTSAAQLMALRAAQRALEPSRTIPPAQVQRYGEVGKRHGYEPYRSSLRVQSWSQQEQEADHSRQAAGSASRGSRSKAATPSRPSTAAGAPGDAVAAAALTSALHSLPAAPGHASRPATAASSAARGSASRPATAAVSVPRGMGSRPATSSSLQHHAPASRPATSSSSQRLALGARPGTAASHSSAPLLTTTAAFSPGGPMPVTAAQLAAAQLPSRPRPQGRTSRRNKSSLINLLDDGSCSRSIALLPPAALLGPHSMDLAYWKNTWQPRSSLDAELGSNLVPGLSPGTKLVGGEWRCLQPKC